MRDAFGRLLADPGALTLADRVDVLRRLSGELQAGGTRERQWLGRALQGWLHSGGDLATALGVKPARGSRTTAQKLMQRAAQDRALLRLSVLAGGDRTASRILCGAAPCPTFCIETVEELHSLNAPTSFAAFARARGRSL